MRTVLTPEQWRARQRAHGERMRCWTEPRRRRQATGEKHPVHDFLFTYYSHRPNRLERWHPGPGVVLAGDEAEQFLEYPGYERVDGGVWLNPAACPPARARHAEFHLALLRATAERAPRLSCFGLHEWAMVYRLGPGQRRHADWPLRLGTAGTDAVLEEHPVRCAHYDAFRFFTDAARPRNAFTPTREGQIAQEQPGCLHANMDLYKAAYKLDPFIASELVADCFELAARIREVDMRASPYDLSALGYTPIRIETVAGRAEYARWQSEFAKAAAPLRAALIEACQSLLAHVPASDDTTR